MHPPVSLLGLSLLAAGVQAATVTYDFNLTWVTTNPDGLYDRPTLGINGQWPLPPIEATIGDHVIVNVQNQLGNRSSSLHFHGLYMNGSTQFDGPVGTSQCSIPAGSSFVYEFDIQQPGTYWYHAHNEGQYPDGLRGPLIIHDPEDPYKDQYDEELVLTLSDWYHDFMPDLVASFISVTNPTGAEPVPDSALMNDTQNLHIDVQPDKTYKIRIINMAAFAAQYLWFEGHPMRVVEVDGITTEAKETDMIYITAAQRYSVLLTTKNSTSKNFAVVGSMDQDLFDTVPDTLNPNVTGWLVYDSKADLPTPATLDNFDSVLDDYTLVPYDKQEIYDKVDHQITLNFKMDNLGDGANYAFFNDVSYVAPKVPTLYSVLSSGSQATDVAIYGGNTNAFVLNAGDVVEIVLNSDDPGKHPFHLHGHNFQAVWRGEENDGYYTGNETLPQIPMRRDTFMVKPQSNIVLRFKADNPGVWLFHCHIEWHIDSGLVAAMIEDPLGIQAQNLSIPQSHWDACKAQGLPTTGNAAGNTEDLLDLSGENTSPAPLPDGFTARGIVAMVFSCVSALLGIAFVIWYGVGEVRDPKKQQ